MDGNPGTLAGTTEAGSKGGSVTTEGNDGRQEQVQEDVGLVCMQGWSQLRSSVSMSTLKNIYRQSPDYKY